MLIRTEPGALAPAIAQLSASNDVTNQILDQLATGLRARQSGQDTLSVNSSSLLSGQIRGLTAARTNVSEAFSLLTTADSGLSNIRSSLERMREIASVASTSIGTIERAFFETEFNDLKNQITQTVDETLFNEIRLLSGSPPPPTPLLVNGTDNADTLNGGEGNDTINGLSGNDTINALGGDDTINAGQGRTPGADGRVYQSGPFGGIVDIAESEAIIASQPVFSNFRVTALDYPNGAQNNQNSTIGNLLGADAATLDNPAAAATNSDRSVYEFTGILNVPADGVYNFSIGSDDGFDLQIDGASVLSFPGPRGFAFTNGPVNLTAGEREFRLVFFENSGSEGLEVFSDLSGGPLAILDDTFLSTPINPTDGNDIIDGGDGTDTVVYDGNQADYTVNVISPTQVQVIDNRTSLLGTNGTDTLLNVEQIQFADATQTVGAPPAAATPGTVQFQVSEDASDPFLEYVIVDARQEALFDAPAGVNVGTQANATAALADVEEAINRLGDIEAYITALRNRTESIDRTLESEINGIGAARSGLQDTDIPNASIEYVNRRVREDFAASRIAQTNQFNRENLSLLLNVGIRQLDFVGN